MFPPLWLAKCLFVLQCRPAGMQSVAWTGCIADKRRLPARTRETEFRGIPPRLQQKDPGHSAGTPAMRRQLSCMQQLKTIGSDSRLGSPLLYIFFQTAGAPYQYGPVFVLSPKLYS